MPSSGCHLPVRMGVFRVFLGAHSGANAGYEDLFRGPDCKPPAPPKKSFNQIFDDFVANKEHGFVLTNAAEELGADVIPELTQRLKRGLHGKKGRAVVIALGKISPELALPLIEVAFGSSYNATRTFAAEYLANHPTPAAKQLAQTVLQKEAHESAKKWLTQCINMYQRELNCRINEASSGKHEREQ